jgi:glycosyltransferase involved in cell wall biosynthesis
MPTCAFVSFRLGSNDGVSIVADRWMDAFESFGFDVTTVAGEGPVHRLIPGLSIGASTPPTQTEIDDAFAAADLVVVENLLTIPMNLPAARVVADALRGRPALLHHHDPPWQRDRYRHITELPLDDGMWRHVTINHLTANEMGQRGIDATTIYNGFDADPPAGRRDLTRAALELDDDELVVVHPVRAIERKAIPRALALAEALGATYWLTGPAEEGYGPELDVLWAHSDSRVIHRPIDDVDDLYAAADLVAFPSVWEGFGNPPIEASIRRRPVAVGDYPVLGELRELGFSWLDVGAPASIASFLRQPDGAVLDHNQSIARQHFSLETMTACLHKLLGDAGWLP